MILPRFTNTLQSATKFISKYLFQGLLIIICLGFGNRLRAQKLGDFSNPQLIPITDNGYGIGAFQSGALDMSTANISSGEYVPEALVRAGLIEKSVWFKFRISSPRNISILLAMLTGNSKANDLGFAVYKNPIGSAGPHNFCPDIPVLEKIGSSGNTCLTAGSYYIQVVARLRVQSSVFIRITSQLPGSTWSSLSKPLLFSFGTGKLIQKSLSQLNTANFQDESIALSFGSPGQTQLINCQFEVNNPYTSYSLSLRFAQLTPLTILILKEDSNLAIHTWQKVDSAQNNAYTYSKIWDCSHGNELVPGKYRVIITGEILASDNIEFELKRKKQYSPYWADIRQLPAFQKLGDLSHLSMDVPLRMSCNTPIHKDSCSELNQNLYRINYSGDTSFLRYQVWYTFEINEESRLEIKNSSYPGFNGVWQVFQGKNASNCQMHLVAASGSAAYCLNPGEYSIRFLLYDDYWALDIPYSINLSFHTLVQHTCLFQDSLHPEILGDITKLLPIDAQGTYFDNQKQMLKISRTQQLEGTVQYREFYISQKSQSLIIRADPNAGSWILNSVDNYLFKGRKSNGTKNQYLNHFRYDKNFPCGLADTGWYTLVSVASIIPETCFSLKEDLPYRPQFDFALNCPAGSNVSQKEYPVFLNSGKPLPLLEGPNHIAIPSVFISRNNCFTCSNVDEQYQTWLSQNCSVQANDEKLAFNFFEFNLIDTGQLFLKTRYTRAIYLLQGSVKNDSNLLYLKSAYLSPCEGGNNYCKILPGNYTIILASTLAVTDSLEITFISAASIPFSFIEQAKDLGLLPGGSLTDHFLYGCSFVLDSSDILLNKVSESDYNWNQSNAVNISIDYKKQGSIWYTFSSDGMGMMDIQCPARSTLYLLNDSLNWQNVQGHPDKRINIAKALILLKQGNSSEYIRYIEGKCTKNRYLLRIPYSGIYKPSAGQLKLSWSPKLRDSTGNDFCSTAAVLNVSQVGKEQIQLDLRCLSLGGDFDEDFMSRSCLDMNKSSATAWLKVHIDIGTSYDVKFNVHTLQSGLKSKIKYRVFRGNCAALTPITCVENLDAVFAFQCVDAGDYYFQIAFPKDLDKLIFALNQLQVNVDVSLASSAPCPIDDPFGLKASFGFAGQCSQDSIRFINYSSQGQDIEYLWDFGDGRQSQVSNPVIWFPKLAGNQEYLVRLMVKNTRLNKTDSFQRRINVLADKLEIWTSVSDTTVRCGTALTLLAHTNLSDFLILYSINSGDTLTGDQVSQRFLQNSEVRFLAWGNGCTIEKNIQVKIDYTLGMIPDTMILCKGDSIELDLSPYTWVYVIPGFIQVPKFSLSMPGDYLVLVNDSGCNWKDEFHIEASTEIFKHGTTDTSVCNLDSLKLETSVYYQSIVWYDGSTVPWKWVKNTGIYAVEGSSGNCRVRDTFYIAFERPRSLFGADSSLCAEEIITLECPIDADSYLWNTEERGKSIQVSDSGLYWLRIKIDQCFGSDSIHFSYYPQDLDLGNDTGFCAEFSMQLDAGTGTDYTWWPLYNNSRYITVYDSGTYGVEKINQYGCYDADTIHIIENCGPYFLMPTAFSPNGDGTNDQLIWSNVDVSEFEIYIYDRWGEKVFSSSNIKDSWDGNYKGYPALDGLYIYHLVYGGADFTGKYFRESLKGYVLLVR